MAVQDQVLEQLADIQRTLGEVVATGQGLKEEVRNQGDASSVYRDLTTTSLQNAFTRIGALEHEVKALRSTIEKTILPLTRESANVKQRVIGFVSAWAMVAGLASALFWFVTQGWAELMKMATRISGGGS